MSRRFTVFVLAWLALMLVRIVSGGFTADLFDGSALLESSFFAAIAAYAFGGGCGARSCSPPRPSHS